MWRAKGKRFFESFDFLTHDSNHGAAQYLDRDRARRAGIVETHKDYAIIRTGARAGNDRWPKRESAKIQTKKNWQYFLMTFRYSAVPHGCGLWPALWTHAAQAKWPHGGELDVLEYANDGQQQTSLHTAASNKCKLDGDAVYSCGVAMPDINGMGYDCETMYPNKMGCAPNKLPLLPGEAWSREGGLVAVQWTEAFLKVWHIPKSEIPDGAESDAPDPNNWDSWLVSYYPFRKSEERVPGSCPDPHNVLSPQHIVLNINMCGDWAGKIWNTSGSCVNVKGPSYPDQCRAVDPLLEYDPQGDCCTQFVYDRNGTFGADEYFRNQGYFNVSWIKVFQERRPLAIADRSVHV